MTGSAMIRALLASALILATAPLGAAQADAVRLSTQDGGIVVEGDLVGFDGEFYEVETIYGRLTLDAALMRCTGPNCPDITTFVPEIRISGSQDMGEVLVPALIEAFADREGLIAQRRILDETRFDYALLPGASTKPAIRFTFRLSTSEEGFADLLAGEADLVLSTREVSAEEQERMIEAGLGDPAAPGQSRVIALDGHVPIVAMSNTIEELRLADLGRIITGDIGNWSDLGGPDQPIELHLRSAASGIAQSIAGRLFDGDAPEISDRAIRHDTNASLSDAVSADPFAIGFAPYSAIGNARALAITGPCGFPNRASSLGLKTEDYPLTAPLFVYSAERRLPKLARGLLAFSGSSASALVVRRSGFVDQRPETMPLSEQGLRLANAIREAGQGVGLNDLRDMVTAFFDAERLTVTYRFRDGSAELDAQSLSNIALLAEALEAGLYDDRTLLFAGFSDGRGDAGQNRRFSERRARAVLDAVLADAPGLDAERVAFEVRGFGEALPMACDEVGWGQRINRRVEIWVR